MNKSIFWSVFILLMTLFTSSGRAALITDQDYQVNGLSYRLLSEANKTVYVSVGCNGVVTIPSTVTIDGTEYTVKEIGKKAFYACFGLTNVTIPNSIYAIREQAFLGCTGLSSIEIPSSVKVISTDSFSTCYFTKSNFVNQSALDEKSLSNKYWGAIIVDQRTNEGICTIGSELVFYGGSNENVVIPSTITSIGKGAFHCRECLTKSVSIPASVTKICTDAFTYCRGLSSLTIPSTVQTIEDGAFSYCHLTQFTNETSLNASENNNWGAVIVDTHTDDGFCIKDNELVWYEGSPLSTVADIPNTVTSIKEHAFWVFCGFLETINIPSGVMSIGDGAFSNCSKSKTIICEALTPPTLEVANRLPSSLESIQVPSASLNLYKNADGWSDYAQLISAIDQQTGPFTLSNDGTTITINEDADLSEIMSALGDKNLDITELYITGDYTTTASIDALKTNYFPNLAKVHLTLKTSATSIGSWAYQNCRLLVEIVVPNTITSIGYSAFHGCSGLTSITIPESVTSIGQYAFLSCSSLESITLPFVGSSATATKASRETLFGYIFGNTNNQGEGSVRVNQYYAPNTFDNFYIPSSLKNVTITGGNLLYGAFCNCSSLTSITIPEGVTSIGESAFYGCSGLTSITIPESVTSIGSQAFKGCSGLTSITIPESVTSIGSQAFEGCSGLTSITIPESVTSIGSQAFEGCSCLTSITIPASVETIGALGLNTGSENLK